MATLITTDLSTNARWAQTTTEAAEQMDFNHAVCLYPEATDQTLEGFGGAMTEAAAVSRKALAEPNRARFDEAVYGESGLRYRLMRTHMGSCDFALGNYTALEAPDAPLDFSRDDTVLIPPMLAAQQAAGQPLSLLLSPWSPPAFMKTNGEMNHGGKLKPEYASAYAALLAAYARHYTDAGLNVTLMSVQNEPEATQTWDSCLFTAEEEGRFAVEHLRPALDKAGLTNVKLLVWDHNKEGLVRRMNGSLSVDGAKQAIDGAAFHWYTGDHFEAVELTHRRFPDKKLYFTEGCVEYSRFGGARDVEKAEMYAHDVIGNLNAGACGSIDWNLLLDEKGGPNHVGNFCEAPLMLNRDDFECKGSYWYIGQFSRYLRAGAVRVATSRYCADVEATAFRNPNGETVVVLLNRTNRAFPVCLAWGDSGAPCAALTLAPHTIVTALL